MLGVQYQTLHQYGTWVMHSPCAMNLELPLERGFDSD